MYKAYLNLNCGQNQLILMHSQRIKVVTLHTLLISYLFAKLIVACNFIMVSLPADALSNVRELVRLLLECKEITPFSGIGLENV
jgi:hypothetical protein